VAPLETLRGVAEVAWMRGVRVHLDGARLPNASAATGIPMREYAACADTVMVALSKGLGAPVGSVLAGSAETMDRVWRIRRRLGGAMRQAGVLAAAGLFALRNNLDRLNEDHRRARRLAEGLAAVPALGVGRPQTNIVMIDLLDPALDPGVLLGSLEGRGVRLTPFGPRRLRAVTHLDVDDAGVERAVEALKVAVKNGEGSIG
jgi:threonine aldolase